MVHSSQQNINLLLLKVAEGNENAFCQLFKTYDSQLNGYIMSMTRSEPLTQEMVQDVFLKIWMNRHSLKEIYSFKSYLFVIARNHTFDTLKQIKRKRKREKEWMNNMVNQTLNDHAETAIDKSYEKIQDAVKLLPPQQKKIYSLKREGMKQADIAQELNISVETVKKHMLLAMRFLKSQIRPNIQSIGKN